ncbi:hypothetical protein QOT17_006787 [Balamuthia mandrillaris]
MSVTEQALVLTKWVNSVLKKKMHQIANLETGFVTGLELAALVELLSNKTIPGLNPSPKNRSQKLQNNQTVLHWLQREERLPIPSKVTAEELVDGNVKHVVALLWELALYYQIGNNQLQPQQPPKKKGSSRKSKHSLQDTKRLRLLAELNVFLKDSSFLPITNFEEAFNDGTILSFLLGRMKQVDGVSAAMMLRTSNGGEAGEGRSGIVSKRTIANSIALLHRHFDVPPLLEAEDLAKGKANELMVMLYISVCLQQLKSYEENVQLRAGAKEYSTATTEGDFDQLNDKLQLGKDLENKLDKDIEKVLQKLRDDQGSHRGSKKYRKGKKNRTQAKSPTLPRWNSEEAAKQQSEGTDIHAAGTPIAAGRKRRGTFMAEAIGRHLPEATKERHRSATISSIHGYPSLPEDLQEDIKAIRKRNKARKKALKEVKKKAPNTKKLLALASGGGLTKEELKVTLEELSRRDGVTEEKAILRDILQRTIEREEQERLKRSQQERKGSSGLEPLGPMMAMGGTVEERTRFMLEQHMGIQFQQKRYENADPTTDKTGTGEKGTDSDDSDDSDDTPTEATDLSDLRLDTLALRVARNQQGPRTIFNLWEEAGMSPEEADVDVFAGSEPNTPRSSDPSNKETTEDTSAAARLQITIATLNTPDDSTPSNVGTTSPPPLPPRAVASAELRQRSATAIPASKVTPTATEAKVAIGTNGSTDKATPVPIPSQQAFKKPGTKPSFTPQPLTPTKQESTLSSKEPTKKGKSYRHPSPSNSKNATPPPLSIPLSTAVAVSTSSCAHTTAKFVAQSKELEQSMPEWDFRWETAMLNPTMKDENMMLDDTLRCFVVASKAVVAAAQELRDAAHTEAHKQAISGAAKEFGQATVHFIHVFKELIHCMKRRQVPPPSQEQQLLNKDIASRYSAGRMTITAKLHALTKVIAAAIESKDQSPEMIRRRAGTTPSSISPQITDHSAPLASPRVAPSISPCPSSTSSVPLTVPILNLPVLDATIHHQRPHSYRGPSPNRTTGPAVAAVASTPRPPPVASRQPCTPLSRLMTHSRSLSTTSAPSSPRLISPLSPPTPRTQRDASSSSSINESMGAGRRRMISLLQSLDASLFAPRSSSFADTSIKDTVAALTGTAKQLLMDGKSLAGEAASMHFQEETCQSILRLCQEFGTQVTELRSFLLQRESGNADALAANKAKVLLALENLIIGAGPVLDALQQTAQQPQLTARSKKKKTFLEYTKKVNQGLTQISSMCKFDDDEEEEMLFDTDAFRQRVFALVATIQKAATILVEDQRPQVQQQKVVVMQATKTFLERSLWLMSSWHALNGEEAAANEAKAEASMQEAYAGWRQAFKQLIVAFKTSLVLYQQQQ